MNQAAFDHEVAIIGTGFSGMGVAIALERVGITDFLLLEKSNDIGGTWRDNQYPGACCDVPSQLYSFSFELNPHWSHRFSPAKEIYAYQQRVMDKYRLRDRTRMGFEVVNATFSDGGWKLVSTNGEQLSARYLVSAIGGLHIPYKPAFDGLDHFAGKLMHSAEWDKRYDYSNKKIIIIGSAASAIQIIPQVAKTAQHVTVMQRTANYFIPRNDRLISAFEKRWFRKLPFIQRLFRWRQYCYFDFIIHSAFLKKGSLTKTLAHRKVRRHFQNQVKDPALATRLTPDYEIGCKRILLSDDYLPAMQRENVSLVTDAVDHFTAGGVVTKDGTAIDADLVILATGFQTKKLFGNMTINGPNGHTMAQAWAREIRAHRSVAVCGFPNFFMTYGPNSGLGHSSMIIMIEAQAGHIARLLQHANQSGQSIIEARAEAEKAYNHCLQKALGETVWSTGCKSWYKDENGHIFTLWPYTTTRFIREMRKAPLHEYNFT